MLITPKKGSSQQRLDCCLTKYPGTHSLGKPTQKINHHSAFLYNWIFLTNKVSLTSFHVSSYRSHLLLITTQHFMFYIFLTISCTIIYLTFCQLIQVILTEYIPLFSEREVTTNNATHCNYFARYH